MTCQKFILSLCCSIPYRIASLVLAWCRFILTTYGIVFMTVVYLGGNFGASIRNNMREFDPENVDRNFEVHISSGKGDHLHIDDAFIKELMTNSTGEWQMNSLKLQLNPLFFSN